MRRLLNWTLVLIVGIAAGSAIARIAKAFSADALDVSYLIVPTGDSIQITAQVEGWRNGSQFGWAGKEALLGIGSVEIHGADGLLGDELVQNDAHSGLRWHSPTVDVATLEVRYVISPPPLTDKVRGTPERIGAVHTEYAALRVEQLFLTFRGAIPRNTSVRLELPQDWITVTPSGLRSGSQRGRSRDTWAHWVAGAFDFEKVQGTRWDLWLHRSLSEELRGTIRADVSELASVASHLLPGAEQVATCMVFVPRLEDEVCVAYLAEPELLVLDVDTYYSRLRAEMARHVLRALTATKDREETWFGVALGEWLADVFCGDTRSVGVLASRSLAYQRRGDDMDILHVNPEDYSGLYWQEARAAKAAALADFLDDLARKAGVEEGLAALAREWAGEGSWRDAVSGRLGSTVVRRMEKYLEEESFPLEVRAPIAFADSPSLPASEHPTKPVYALSLAYNGNGEGRLETCGCTDEVTGGLARRASALADRKRSRGPEYVPIVIELGDFLTHHAPRKLDPIQDSEQRLYLDLLRGMPTDVVILGQGEMLRGPEWFHETFASVDIPIVSANIRVSGRSVAPPFRIVRRAGISVGIIGFSEPWMEERDFRPFGEAMSSIEVDLSIEELGGLFAQLRAEADLTVLAGRIGPESLHAVLREHGNEVDMVLTVDTRTRRGAPIDQRATAGGFVGRTLVLFHPLQDRALTFCDLEVRRHQVLGFTIDGRLLDAEVPDDPAVVARLDRFFSSLGERPETLAVERHPMFQGDSWVEDFFVDESTCNGCHPSESAQWRTTEHAKAFNTLLQVTRQHHPDCVRCHVTGFGWRTGYRMSTPNPMRHNVGCQSCHGSAGRHLASPTAGTIHRTPERATCVVCHDDKHSPLFAATYGEYLSKVVHSSSPTD